MSKHNRSFAGNRSFGRTQSDNRKAAHQTHGRKGKRFDKPHRPAAPRRPQSNFIVVNKADVVPGIVAHKAKFVPAKSGGLMAAIRVNGRIVFPDRKGMTPANDGKEYSFFITGENPKGTVYFALVVPSAKPVAPTAIKKTASGKLIAVGGRGLPLKLLLRSNPAQVKLGEYRSAKPTDGFEPDPDNYRDTWYSSCSCGECSGGFSCDDVSEEDEDAFAAEADHFGLSLPTRPVSCFSCGFEDCRCDGTASDWVPARTTLNVLA